MENNEALEQHLRTVHQLAAKEGHAQAVQEHYDKWASTYDQDHDIHQNTAKQYSGPAISAEALSQMLADKNAPIVDCAAGTGRVGEELAKRGHTKIDAVDFSTKCLEISASKGVYDRLICDTLGKGRKLKDVEDGYYSGLTCVGGISIGHLKPDVFPEFTRIVKKGGYIVFTLSWLLFPDDPKEHTDTMLTFEDAIHALVQDGAWEIVKKAPMDSFVIGYGANIYTIRRL